LLPVHKRGKMALINDLSTTQGRQEELRARISYIVTMLFQQMRDIFTESFNLIWFNNVLTPQEAVDALGSDAAELFRLAEVLTMAVNSAKPDTITPGIPAGFTVSFNEDGTATIGQAQE
jgi:hypothetical protein